MYTLAPLPYDYSALEPWIDTETMKIHHDKHHQAYVDNLNKLLENFPDLAEKSSDWLISNLSSLSNLEDQIRTKVKNNLGGVLNHNFFWQIMTGANSGKRLADSLTIEEWNNLTIAKKIIEQFDSIEKFQEQFGAAALSHFGSGWCWLIVSEDKLQIKTTPNQDYPLTSETVSETSILLGLDVWEHAYYLKYQNRRKEYIENWWNIVNWTKVDELYLGGLSWVKRRKCGKLGRGRKTVYRSHCLID